MSEARVYLDYNATAPLRPAAREALTAALALGNPSSVHAEGRAARAAVETARAKVAALVGADARTVTFTSGATEANVLALSPDFAVGDRIVHLDVLLLSGVEHPSVRTGGRFPADHVEILPVDGAGVVEVAALEGALAVHKAQGRRALVSVMAANNETGALQPLPEIAARVHEAGGLFHSDAVQIAGRLPFGLAESGADLISVSSHKLGGPHGAGALVTRDESMHVPPLLRGGGQEFGRRAGTENVAALAGFGAAAETAEQTLAEEPGRQAALREAAEEGLRRISPEVVVLAGATARLPNTLCFAVPGVAAETAIMALDLEGIALSAGAACSSGKVGESEALKAMRQAPEIVRGAMRLSIGWDTNDRDISRFLEVWERVYLNLGQRRRNRAA